MSLLKDAIANDSGLGVAAKYLVDVVAPFFEMPLTGDTDKVRDFHLGRLLGELEALIYRIPPSPSSTQRMRFLAGQMMDFAVESGVPTGSDDSFVDWVRKNGNSEDIVMETVFEIDLFLETSFSMSGAQVGELQSIRKNLLVNFQIFQDLQQTMILGGPGSQDELESFEKAVEANIQRARNILDSFSYY